MRKKYLLLSVLIFSMLFMNSCGKLKSIETEAAISETKNVPAFQVINKPSSDLESLSINYIYNNDYNISVKYPSTPHKNLNSIVEEMVYSYINEHKQDLSIDFETIKYSDTYVSFKFNIEYFLEDKNKFSIIKTFTFDLDSGRNILLKDIFKSEVDYLQLLSKKIPIDILANYTIIDEDSFDCFAVNEKNLMIYFHPDKSIVDSEVIGNTELFEIPLEDICNELVFPFDTIEKSIEETEVKVEKEEKLIAITFDDGPNPLTTPVLLDGLAERNVKATFFMLGTCAEKNSEIVKRMYADGHDIGNHSYSHKNLPKIPNSDAKIQYDKPNEILNSIIGTNSTLFRPPYGHYNQSIKEFIDTPIILWNIDPEDWKYKDADGISKHIVDRAKDGDIILLHDIYATSVEAAFKVIDTLQEQGFKFVTVDELIRRDGKEPELAEVFMNKSIQK